MNKSYHFIAIGGIGMSALAKYLLEEGFEVSGSDINKSKYTDALEKMGAKIFVGHSEDNLPKNSTVIASTAIREDNPELKKAKELGFEVLHRSDLLARIANGVIEKKKKHFLGFSGTHGKTTTSGLASYVLEKAGYNPAFVVGGIVPEIGTNAKSGGKDFFVAELDESDGTIIKYQPEISIINNLEVDHVDFYTDGLQSILNTFKIYLNQLQEGAKILINNDCEGNLKLMEQNPDKNFITFGLENSDYVAKNIIFEAKTSFDIYYKEKFLTDLNIQLLGKHNVYNSLAVFAALNESGANIEKIKEHFATFSGMGRRFQLVAEFDGISVYDDYAHHPTEIKATLEAASKIKDKNIVAVFQPHRYSRLQGLWDDFLTSFDNADKVFVTDVYAASEDEIPEANAQKFVEELSKKINIPCEHLSGDMKKVAKNLLPKLQKNDVVIGLGAGTITALGKELKILKDEAYSAN